MQHLVGLNRLGLVAAMIPGNPDPGARRMITNCIDRRGGNAGTDATISLKNDIDESVAVFVTRIFIAVFALFAYFVVVNRLAFTGGIMSPVKNERTVDKARRKPGQAQVSVFDVLGKTLQGVGRNISIGTDRIADVIADDSASGKEARRTRLKEQAVAMVVKTGHDIKKDMSDISLTGIARDISNGTGVLSKRLMEADCTDILNQTCYGAGRFSRVIKDALF